MPIAAQGEKMASVRIMLFLCVVLPFSVTAQTGCDAGSTSGVAVLKLRGQNVADEYLIEMSRKLRNELAWSGLPVTRGELPADAASQPDAIFASVTSVQDAGRSLGTDKVISGSIAAVPGQSSLIVLAVSLRVVDVSTGTVSHVVTREGEFTYDYALNALLPSLAAELAAACAGESTSVMNASQQRRVLVRNARRSVFAVAFGVIGTNLAVSQFKRSRLAPEKKSSDGEKLVTPFLAGITGLAVGVTLGIYLADLFEMSSSQAAFTVGPERISSVASPPAGHTGGTTYVRFLSVRF